jgi:hypothetical protein
MEIKTRSIRELAYRCEEFLADDGRARAIGIGYPNSLALCILDALFTTGSHPTAVDNVVAKYIACHGDADGAKSLRYSIAAAGGAEAWAREVICNLKPAHTQPGAMLRAEVVDRATRLMADLGIDTVDDLLAAVGDEPSTGRHANRVARAWRELPSQKSGISWRALLMLAGSDHFDVDYQVGNYLYQVFGWFNRPSEEQMPALIDATADYFDVDPRVVRQIVWQVSHRRLRPDPKRKALDLPYPLDDEIDDELDEPDWWPGAYDPVDRCGAKGWATVFDRQYRAVPFGAEKDVEPDQTGPYPMSGTTGAAPF